MQTINTDVFIAGAGPAGTSAVLHLLHRDPSWAERLVIVDRAVFPREKLCGGALAITQDAAWNRIGVAPPAVPSVDVNDVYTFWGTDAYALEDVRLRVVRRRDYDAALVREVEARQVPVRQGESVEAVTVRDDAVEILTDRAFYRAKALIAADGSNSAVRRRLKWPGGSHLARLIEILTPAADAANSPLPPEQAAFDFSDLSRGLGGYTWDFPCIVGGELHVNRGIYDSNVSTRHRADLKAILGERLRDRGLSLSDYPLLGHPIRWYDPRERYSQPRVLLAGDAAGVDPLLGEGISFAIAYGELAADCLIDADASGDWRFEHYSDRIKTHAALRQLVLRYRLAHAAFRSKQPHRLLERALLAWAGQ
jgi:menaquinone-9 beta-reductase